MAKKRTAIKSADGVPLKAKMTVFQIHTRDGGKSWFTGMEQQVHEVRRGPLSGVKLTESLTHCIGGELAGDNRIFASEKKAEAECKRRNKAAKK